MLSKSRSDLFSKECHFISTQTAIRRNHHANLRLSFDMLRDTRGDFDAMSARNTVVMAEVHLIRALCEMKKPFREKLLLIQRSYGRPQGGGCQMRRTISPLNEGVGGDSIVPLSAPF